ncbi:MAG TPA: hypothetical protein VI279_17050 [Rhodocyclaceae bacterium]
MKPVDRAAGSRRAFLRAGLVGLAGFCAACASNARQPGKRLLEPVFSIGGGRQVARMDVAGGVRPDAIGGYIPFIFPVAVAAHANGDIFIADAGASRLYRYDRGLDALITLPEKHIGITTRLQIGPDGSVYVLDGTGAEIRRYSRIGQRLTLMQPRLPAGHYSEFAVDPLSGKVYAVDSSNLSIDEIHPLGQASIDLQRIDEPGPIASDGRSVWVAGSLCRCVTEWTYGRKGRVLAAGQLQSPRAITLLDGRLFAIDGVDRVVAYVHEQGVERLVPSSLGLMLPEGLHAAQGLLFVADGAGRRVSAFRPGFEVRP